MRSSVWAWCGALLLAGCLAPPPAEGPAPPGSEARPEATVPGFDPPAVLEFRAGNEPSIRATPEDHLYVVATQNAFWRSLDGGVTWDVPVARPCLPPAGLLGCVNDNGLQGPRDASLAVDARGRLHWAGLGTGTVPYQWSDDEGLTWSEAVDLAEGGNATDRQWIIVDGTGRVYVVWREFDGGNVTRPAAVKLRVSSDRGTTWDAATVIVGVPAGPAAEPPIAGAPAIDPRSGALYVPLTAVGVGGHQMARSLDQGATWGVFDLPGRVEDSAVTSVVPTVKGNIFPVAAVDDGGTVYAAWSEDREAPGAVPSSGGKPVMVPKVFLSMSRDGGATWSPAAMVSPPDRAAVFPAILAGAPGRVALGWYESSMPLPSETAPTEWFVTLAMSTTADAEAPVWAAAHTTDQPIHVGSICTSSGTFCSFAGDRSRGDFFEMDLRPNGLPVVAYVQDTVPPGSQAQRSDVVVVRVLEGTPLR